MSNAPLSAPPTAEMPVRLPYGPGMASARPALWHSGTNLPRFFFLHVLAAMLPIAAGLLLYGWRALLMIALVTGSAAAAVPIWKRIGTRGAHLRTCHVLWLSLLLALMLPVHLMTTDPPFPGAPGALWAIPCGAGMLVVIFAWLLGGVGAARIHPVLVAYLLLVVVFKQTLVPHWVLHKDRLFIGDVARSERAALAITSSAGWVRTPSITGQDGIYEDAVSEKLFRYTSGQQRPDHSWLSLDGLLRDEMPPLEDLILGGQPGPIGAASAIAVIVGGLFLLYHGVIDFRIPLLIYLSAFLALLLLPIPAVIQEIAGGGRHAHIDWRWLALRDPNHVGVARAITFVNYETLAGPLLFMAFFLATAPAVRPMARRARAIFAVLIGLLAAVFQLYVSVSFGPYLALLIVSLVTPTCDKVFRPRPLV
jgi:Na+-translocating ferredoxin:NAD+ oxidoreductase RnfD subunit